MKRRDFLGLSLASTCAALSSCVVPVAPAKKKSQILVLGGTNFVGPAIVEHALAHGHEVTLFNRGITRSHLFPGIEKLRGLRAVNGGDLSALQNNRKWDAVIDVWPEESGLVEQTARLLSERTDYYFFVSSIAVYRDFSKAGLTENSPVHENDPGWYGGEKVLAEKMLERYFPGRFGVARCHAIIGPRDDGNAYHYWLRRIAGNTQVLAPGSGKDPV
ncbi:MAG: NAD-dependent epimerase/dehydratase family protein, partial [Gammaproteobacteria bacterium]|nr:NAD-dependent epimerase/dehydratase family protein [Gammaproteobacteria bacterium]